MKNLIIALTLSVISSASFANGFSPWDDRGVIASQGENVTFDSAATDTGFAPWRERASDEAFADEQGIAMDIVDRNVFRPWS